MILENLFYGFKMKMIYLFQLSKEIIHICVVISNFNIISHFDYEKLLNDQISVQRNFGDD